LSRPQVAAGFTCSLQPLQAAHKSSA